MPKLYLPVPEIEKSITRPVLLDIVRQVKEITGISKDTKEVFLGDARSGLQAGSTVGSDILDNTNISASKQLFIEISEQFNENSLGTVALAQTENIPIFIDDVLGVVLKPIYTSRTFEIRIRYRNPSKTEAKSWRDNIYMHVNHLRDVNLHNAVYHYIVPKPFFVLLQEIHRLRENVESYGDTFENYFLSKFTKRVTEATTLTGDSATFVIPERQMRIQGWFTFQGSPEREEMGGETNMWISEFTYSVTLDVPTGVHMSYPIMVHNQLLDDKYIPKAPEDDELHDKALTHYQTAFHRFEGQRALRNAIGVRSNMIFIPKHDDWLKDNAPPGMQFVLSALCELLPDNRKLLLNLDELGDYAIDEEVLEYFRAVEYRYLTLPYKSIFHLSYYRHKFLSTDRNTYVDADLNFMTKEDLSLRENHRVVLSLVNDVSAVDPAAFKRMKKYPNVLRKVLKAIRVTKHQLIRLSPVVDLTAFMPELGVTQKEIDQAYLMFPILYTVSSSHVTARDQEHTGKIGDEKKNPVYPVYNKPHGL